MNTITFSVRGLPQAQGSTRAFMVKGRPVLTSTNKNLKQWRQSIALAAQPWAPSPLWAGPIHLYAVFQFPRPKSLRLSCLCGHQKANHKLKGGLRQQCRMPGCDCATFRERLGWPTGHPDLDKVARALNDALTNVIWRDDAQVVDLQVTKRYGDPGVQVRVSCIGEESFP